MSCNEHTKNDRTSASNAFITKNVTSKSQKIIDRDFDFIVL